MNFFVDPAFFLLLIPLVAVAVILGVCERSLKGYGCIVSIGMLGFLFSRSLPSLGFFIGFLALSSILFLLVRHWFSDGRSQIVPYRIALAVQILPLFIYKLNEVFDATLLGFIGISYITFKSVQVLIEIRDGLITKMSLYDYFAFLLFFPTFTSGPILRSRAFLDDLAKPRPRAEYLRLFYEGCGWFVLGAVYKFVGAALANWCMWFLPVAIGDGTPFTFAAGQVVYSLSYGIYLFCDFAGYCAMAMGVGFVLGVKVPRNFHAPFRAIDIKDFWNRWNITLSFWLRDFIFMRLVGFEMKRKLFSSRLTSACVAFIVEMTIMGFWHGITVDYVVYGLYHGVLLSLCELTQRKWGFYKKHKNDRWFKLASWAVTMVAVFFGLSLFSGQIATLVWA